VIGVAEKLMESCSGSSKIHYYQKNIETS